MFFCFCLFVLIEQVVVSIFFFIKRRVNLESQRTFFLFKSAVIKYKLNTFSVLLFLYCFVFYLYHFLSEREERTERHTDRGEDK